MKQQVKIEIKKGKVIHNADKIRDLMSSADDGFYIWTLEDVQPLKTPREYQNAYFAMVDVVAQHTGNDRYTVHEGFKVAKTVQTTKDMTVEQWKELHHDFRWWAFNEFNCIV
jgi:hypothetical protein